MKNYAKFGGRACRAEAVSFYPFFFILRLLPIFFLVLPTLLRRAGVESVEHIGILSIILFFISIILIIVHIIPCLSLGARRLHDLNMSGWLQLIMFLPLCYLIFFIIFCTIPGAKESNSYGPVSEKY